MHLLYCISKDLNHKLESSLQQSLLIMSARAFPCCWDTREVKGEVNKRGPGGQDIGKTTESGQREDRRGDFK